MTESVNDKYKVLEKLGEGATATVYRGQHLAIGKDVAIKVLHPHLSSSSRYRERFNREARACGRLSHENIVSILDYSGQNAEDCYIVTELVVGATLLELIEQHGKLPSEIVLLIGIELAKACAFAHRAGIIHRDIKPENVMIRRDGVIKLMDFGVARVADEGQITLDGSLLGSPAYMSPQQAVDDQLDGRSDLFSLGTVLFHAVTGHIPFAGTNASIILRNIIDGQRAEVLELSPEAAPALASAIDRLLQTRAEDRYADADTAAEALRAALDESGIPAGHPLINVRSWLVNPPEVNDALRAHLQTTLLERGKARLAAGDTVGALQLFNRLLALDEDQAEVMALIQALHTPTRNRQRAGVAGAIGAAVLLVAALTAWAFFPRAAPPEPARTSREDVVDRPDEGGLPSGSPPMKVQAAPIPPEPSLPTMPVSAPAPAVRLAAVGRPSGSPAAPASPAVASDALPSAGPGRVLLDTTQYAEVWVDGRLLGSFRSGSMSSWVGTEKNPILLTPGAHRLELRNEGAEPWVEEITIAAAETRRVVPRFRRKPTTFTVNPRMPSDCTLTVGDTPYGRLDAFGREFTKPADETTNAVFDCGKRGSFPYTLPPTRAGENRLIPQELPPELAP